MPLSARQMRGIALVRWRATFVIYHRGRRWLEVCHTIGRWALVLLILSGSGESMNAIMPFSVEHASDEARRQADHRHVGLPMEVKAPTPRQARANMTPTTRKIVFPAFDQKSQIKPAQKTTRLAICKASTTASDTAVPKERTR